MKNNNNELTIKQTKLLRTLIADEKTAPKIYKPSKHWRRNARAAINEIKKNGLNGFRSSTDINTAAAVYGDASIIDYRRLIDTSSILNKLGLAIINKTRLRTLFDAQTNATKDYVKRLIELQKNPLTFANHPRLKKLIENHKIENSINFGCDRITIFEDKKYSRQYLENLDILDFAEKNQTFKDSNSFLEIGPGYGTLIHLIEQNYPNIRKFIAVDIVPNVWVVTEYLRSHYGDSVKDYLETKDMKEIKFKDDNSLEIFVIPSWQIEKISSPIDCFWNSISFIEMSPEIVKNYAEKIAKISTDKSIYNFIDAERPIHELTFESTLIPSLFPKVNFKMVKYLSLLEGDEMYFYLGKLSS